MIKLVSYIITVLVCISIACPIALNGQSPEVIEVVYLEKDQGLIERVMHHTIRDSKGYFYFFYDNHVQRYDGKFFEIVNISTLSRLKESLIDIESVSLLKKKIWIKFKSGQYVSIKSGELYFNKEVGAPTSLLNQFNNPNLDSEWLSILKDGKSYKWERGKASIIDNGHLIQEFTLPSLGKPKFLRLDSKGNILAAYSTSVNYVDNYYILDNTDHLHDFSHLTNYYDTVKDIYSDNFFYKWMVCGYNGVQILTLKREGVDFILNKPGVAKGQFGAVMTGISSLDSLVYMTTENGDLFEYNPSRDTCISFNRNYAFVSGSLGKMVYDDRRKLHILKGTDGFITDLFFINAHNKSITAHQLEGYYRDFIIDEDESILLAGQTESGKGQVLSLDPETKISSVVVNDLPPLRAIYFHKDLRQYYLGTKEGLYICDSNFKILSSFGRDQLEDNYLYHQEILYMSYYNGHIVACSNGGGVFIIDPKTHVIVKKLTIKNGMSDETAISALIDDSNRCWIATFNGLNVIDSSFNVIKSIYEFDGLPSREFNSFSATKHKGQLYFGTLNGTVKIDPNKVMAWESSQRISIEEVYVFNNKGINEIKIDSTSINLLGPDSLTLRYAITDYFSYPYNLPKLNVITEHNSVSVNLDRSEINFGKLDKGITTIECKLGYSEESVFLNLMIDSDYTRYLNAILWLVSILFLSAMIVYYATQYIKKRELQKTKENKKISELQLSALQGQMNPHFIFNALGAIQYFIQTNDVNKADGYLSDFALLMRGILDSSSKKFITIKEELKLLKLYVGLEKARFENKFDVHFIVDDNIDEETLIPPMIIQPYIENAVNHGLHHLKERRGRLDVLINYKDDILSIVIEDNGIGREAAQKLRSNPKHISRAMGITNERIQTINKTSEIKITIAVVDLKDDFYNPTGTRISIDIVD